MRNIVVFFLLILLASLTSCFDQSAKIRHLCGIWEITSYELTGCDSLDAGSDRLRLSSDLTCNIPSTTCYFRHLPEVDRFKIYCMNMENYRWEFKKKAGKELVVLYTADSYIAGEYFLYYENKDIIQGSLTKMTLKNDKGLFNLVKIKNFKF